MTAYNIHCGTIFTKTLIKQHLQFGQRPHGLNNGLAQGTGNSGQCEKAEVTANYGLGQKMWKGLHDQCS